MRSKKMGCLVFGLFALFVMVFFNGGGNSGIVEIPSDVNETSSAGGASDGGGELEPLGDLDADNSDLGATDDGGVSLELESDDGDAGNGSGGNAGVLSGEVDAQVSDVNYIVIEAVNEGPVIDTLYAEGEFVVVRLLIENTGADPLTYFGANMVDDHGQEYSYISDALPYIVDEEACEVVTIEPGEERVCTMVYDINDNANAVGIILTDLNLLGGEESIVELAGLP